MALLVSDCPRCGTSSMTFDVMAELYTFTKNDWVRYYELFCVCRHCTRSTTFIVTLSDYDARDHFRETGSLVAWSESLNPYFGIEGFINIADMTSVEPPEHLPEHIAAAFSEAAVCLTVKCFNAAGAMFRLCVDLATRPLLPDPQDTTVAQPNNKQCRDLGLRLRWLFENDRLPSQLEELAKCIREDGNDGAHAGSLTKVDAEDLLDFTTTLLERLYTEPQRLALAEERRRARRSKE
jgi:Domain of unknown function (DUF4145)